MTGFLFALIAGAAMSIQGVMNTRLGEKAGVLETNAFVQLTGFALALAIALERIWSRPATSSAARATP